MAGIEYNPAADEIGPIANWIAHTESEKWPMISFGTSSDRIGTPRGYQSYYVTFAKSLPSLKAGPYVSISYSETDEKFLMPFGVNVTLENGFSLLGMNDGKKSHLLLTYSTKDWSLTGMLVWLKRPGISFSFGF